MKNINIPTAVAAVIGIVGTVVLAALKADTTVVAGYAGTMITILSAMEKVYK